MGKRVVSVTIKVCVILLFVLHLCLVSDLGVLHNTKQNKNDKQKTIDINVLG
jgi:hypothetical protein